MAVNLSPVFGVAGQLFDNNGNPLAGGKIFTYLAGTTTNATTYTSSNGSIAHSNPIILDGAGRVPSGEIWLTDGITYKFVVQDSANNLIGTYDNLTGINSNFVAFTNSQEIQTATAGQTVFNLTTMQYQVGTNSLSVFVDGVNQYGPGAQYAYVETDDNTVTFVSGLHVGASVKFTTSQLNSSGAGDASQVTYDPPFTNSVVTNVENKLAQTVSVKDFGAVGNGVADDTQAIQNAIDWLTDGGSVFFPSGTYIVTSQIVVSSKVSLFGEGVASENGIGAAFRGATCIVRDFVGSNATVALNGDACGMDMIDVDGDLQGTGDGVQVWGSRVNIGTISTRNNGGDGLRIGKTEAGPSTANCNFWRVACIITCGNTKNGFRIDQTNTSTTTSYPLGLSDCNAGFCGMVDARSNGEDGLQLGNCNDNVFANVGSQANAGIGIHFKTDGTNSGPRCNTILGNDSEANVGNDIQIDAATLPVSGPGLYNKIYGNRSVAVNSRIVDNSTGSLIFQWNSALLSTGYQLGKSISALNSAGDASFDGYAGANAAVTRVITKAVGTTGARQEVWTKKDAGALALRGYWGDDGSLVFNPTGTSTGGLGVLIGKTTADTTTPGIQLGDLGTGNFYTRINMVGDGTSSDTKIGFYNANGFVGGIVTSGTATAYNIASDYRLKESVQPVDASAALASVMSWPIKSFKWKVNGQYEIGVIAHELQAVKPTAVSGEKDAMRNGEIDPQGVDYSKLIPELVAAVQYLAKRVAELEKK